MNEISSETQSRIRHQIFTHIRKGIWEIITTVIPAVLAALFINVYVAEAVEIEFGSSMEPNMYVGYHVMTEKISYRLHPPRRGDIVVVDVPNEPVALIKRVIGLPGETIEVRGGHTYINGKTISEPWVTYFGGAEYPATLIPDSDIFIMGDNRIASRDSRVIGTVPLNSILRKAWLVYWPWSNLKWIP